MTTEFERLIQDNNEHFFYREFTFSVTKFKTEENDEFELSDSLVWIGDALICIQIKERGQSKAGDQESERRWYENKVIKKATKQVRDTIDYLWKHDSIELTNHAGDVFNIATARFKTKHHLVLFNPGKHLPEECWTRKHHDSKTAGVIHVISVADYLNVVRTLLTLAEVVEYLSFREDLIRKWPGEVAGLPEPALLGQFLDGDSDKHPSASFIGLVERLQHEAEEWDLSGVISKFKDRTYTEYTREGHYALLTEIAKLNRAELRDFKLRFQKAWEDAKGPDDIKPYRFFLPRTQCGFIFAPLIGEYTLEKLKWLEFYTGAHKHDMKAEKCVGAVFIAEEGGYCDVSWTLINEPWEPDDELDKLLEETKPLRPVKEGVVQRYKFEE